MYIYDALYGKIEFSPLVWKCMMTPEVQRLREVRLCNINSLCITGSSNTNRFEHSVGTAFLAQYNVQHNKKKYLSHKQDLDLLIISALLHDIANGPFGHSYEYLMEKQGFVPEKGLKTIFTSVVTYNQGANGYSAPFEQIYFGKLRALTGVLNDSQKNIVSDIIAGNHYFSKLISDKIDLDNIDNVFRMAYHMGIPFPMEAPLELAKSMYLEDDKVVFEKSAEPYLNAWYETRKKVYKFLLLNPQEFAGKYMLTEAMDIVFEDKTQNKTPWEIKWYFTDFELLKNLHEQTEKWIHRKYILKKQIDISSISNLSTLTFDEQKAKIKKLIESIELTTPIKDKGKTGNSNKLFLTDSFKFEINESINRILIEDRNMTFEISNQNLYKITLIKYNPSQIISRLVSGDLYDCLMIIKTNDISKYGNFLNYTQRLEIENELESSLRNDKDFQSLSIGIHPILDYNKTERQLEIMYEGESSISIIGNSSKDLLLGIFLKNEPYGLKHAKMPLKNSREKLKECVTKFFSNVLDGKIDIIGLYEEANEYGYKRYHT